MYVLIPLECIKQIIMKHCSTYNEQNTDLFSENDDMLMDALRSTTHLMVKILSATTIIRQKETNEIKMPNHMKEH